MFCAFIAIEKTPVSRWVVNKGGSLTVNGSTNVNTFKCDIVGYGNPDTLAMTRRQESQPFALQGSIKLPVKMFNCHNPIMTGDLRKTLKQKEFPYLIIKFLSLQKLPTASAPNEIVKGFVDIDLAGVTKRFEVNYTFSNRDAQSFTMIGSRDINFSDFNLSPPTKLGGMIRTNNELSVQFRLSLTMIK